MTRVTPGARLWLCRSLESRLRSQARRRWVPRVLWNGIAYVFFGFGTKTSALGIRDTAIFGPEIGILGLISNAVFAFYSGNGGEHAVIARRRSRRSDRSVPLIRTRSCARTTQQAGPAIQARVPQNADR